MSDMLSSSCSIPIALFNVGVLPLYLKKKTLPLDFKEKHCHRKLSVRTIIGLFMANDCITYLI